MMSICNSCTHAEVCRFWENGDGKNNLWISRGNCPHFKDDGLPCKTYRVTEANTRSSINKEDQVGNNGCQKKRKRYLIARQYSVREIRKMLNINNFEYVRTKGSHEIWKKATDLVVLPVTQLNYKLGVKIVRQIEKSNSFA